MKDIDETVRDWKANPRLGRGIKTIVVLVALLVAILILNPFVIDADWRPVAAAWEGEGWAKRPASVG